MTEKFISKWPYPQKESWLLWRREKLTYPNEIWWSTKNAAGKKNKLGRIKRRVDLEASHALNQPLWFLSTVKVTALIRALNYSLNDTWKGFGVSSNPTENQRSVQRYVYQTGFQRKGEKMEYYKMLCKYKPALVAPSCKSLNNFFFSLTLSVLQSFSSLENNNNNNLKNEREKIGISPKAKRGVRSFPHEIINFWQKLMIENRMSFI